MMYIKTSKAAVEVAEAVGSNVNQDAAWHAQ